MGVLFEISIVCHVLCSWFWRGGWGFSLFWGLFWLVRRVFSGFWGFLCFSLFCSCLLGWVAGCGGFRGSGFGAPGWFVLLNCWGAGWGVRLRAPGFLASSLLGGGFGCACCPVPVVGVGLCPVPAVIVVGSGCVRFFSALLGGGGLGVFFSVRRFSCSPGFRCWSSWSCRGWGVVGGVGLGSGFFLRLLLYWPGPVWVWVGFCLESLILAQDERWRRA